MMKTNNKKLIAKFFSKLLLSISKLLLSIINFDKLRIEDYSEML